MEPFSIRMINYRSRSRNLRARTLFFAAAAILLVAGAVLASIGCHAIPYQSYQRSAGPFDRTDLPLHFRKIADNLYLYEDFNYWKSNGLIYAGEDGILFFNSGWSPASARQLLWRGAVLSVADYIGVVVTSHTLQHSGGLARFWQSQVPVIMSHGAANEMDREWAAINLEMGRSFSSWRNLPYVPADQIFRERLELLDGRVVLIEPSRRALTPGATLVWFPEERILYGGTLFADPLWFSAHADRDGYRELLELVESLDPLQIVAGHGRPLHHPGPLLSAMRLKLGIEQ